MPRAVRPYYSPKCFESGRVSSRHQPSHLEANACLSVLSVNAVQSCGEGSELAFRENRDPIADRAAEERLLPPGSARPSVKSREQTEAHLSLGQILSGFLLL